VVGDENAETEAPPIRCRLGLPAPACPKVGILCKELVDIQHPGFVQPVGRAGESGMLREMLVDVRRPGFVQGVERAGELEMVRKVLVDVRCPGFVQGVGWAGESEMVREVLVDVRRPGLVLSAEGGLCWQHPHRPTQSLLVEHASATCAYEGPTPVLACRIKISSFTRCGRRTRSTI